VCSISFWILALILVIVVWILPFSKGNSDSILSRVSLKMWCVTMLCMWNQITCLLFFRWFLSPVMSAYLQSGILLKKAHLHLLGVSASSTLSLWKDSHETCVQAFLLCYFHPLFPPLWGTRRSVFCIPVLSLIRPVLFPTAIER
jgi:hypothetical protein